ncbi:MAG: hypothetical protein M3238_03415, partial [Actinomycetota bacterium]|nr:hypothetical protein [Actinomycetota bacterium]
MTSAKRSGTTRRGPIAVMALLVAASIGIGTPAAAARPKCEGKIATKVGTAGDDTILGTKRADVIVARGGNDSIFGQGGNDVICGGPGGDIVIPGSGDDRILGQLGGDLIAGQAGNDHIVGGRGPGDIAAFLFSPSPVVVDLTIGSARGEGRDRLLGIEGLGGSDHDDVLIGNDQSNTILAGAGDDEVDSGPEFDGIQGEGGNDRIDGGADNDVVFNFGAESPVTVDLAAGTQSGESEGEDTLSNIEGAGGTELDDVLLGDDNDNFLLPGGGVDQVDGRGGDADTVFYSLSTAGVTVDLGRGTATGEGDDTLTALEAVFGSAFDDTLTGTAQGDILQGDTGNDTIKGEAGDDWLVPGPGDDTVDGGPGTYDLVNFFASTRPVSVDLGAGTAIGEGTDTL